MTFHIAHPHTLADEEVRERLAALGDYLGARHAIAVSWTSPESATVRGAYLSVNIEATVRIEGSSVVFEGKDPGFQWREKTREYFQGKLARYLDPSVAFDALPRE